MTRILIVTAYKPGSARRPAEQFVKHVKDSFKNSVRSHEKIEFLFRRHTELAEYLPPAPSGAGDASEIAQAKYCITALDGLDFLFIDGDEQLLPWLPQSAPLLKLMHLCAIARKCVFATGCGVQFLTYLGRVGPIAIPVLNGGGLGGAVVDFRPPPEAPAASVHALGASAATTSMLPPPDGVMLDNRTGDMFRFDAGARAWLPVGNVGMHCSFGKMSGASRALRRDVGSPADPSRPALALPRSHREREREREKGLVAYRPSP